MAQIRLHKFLAEAGVASRRACEEIILEGRVSVDGQQISELGFKIDPEISKAYYGKLNGIPDIYTIKSSEPFNFYINII